MPKQPLIVNDVVYRYREFMNGQSYGVRVLKVWWLFALCEYQETLFGYYSESYVVDRVKWKPIWRIF